MKKKERYKLLVHAKEDYSNKFNCNYEFKKESSEIPLALADGLNGECRIYNYK